MGPLGGGGSRTIGLVGSHGRASTLVNMTNEDMRQTYLGRVVPLLQEVSIEVPVKWNASEKRWEYGELPWNEWNQLQRRLERPAARSGT